MIVIVSCIDRVIWIIEADYIYFGLMELKCGFGWTRSGCVSALVEVFWPGAIFVIDLYKLFPYSLFTDEQATLGRASFQVTITLYWYFSHVSIVHSTTFEVVCLGM